MVVKQRELFKGQLQRGFGRNHRLTQQRLQGSKQAFNAPVLPRRASLNPLMANTDKLQERGEHKAGEHTSLSVQMRPGLPCLPIARHR